MNKVTDFSYMSSVSYIKDYTEQLEKKIREDFERLKNCENKEAMSEYFKEHLEESMESLKGTVTQIREQLV